jgi:hypothetical protein
MARQHCLTHLEKYIMIKQILAAALIVSATAVSAQTDSTQSQPAQQTQPTQQQPGSQYSNTRDYTQIQSQEVPASLRTTLQGSTYKGWESGKVYKLNNGNGYRLSTGTGNTTKEYYFDNKGQAIQNSRPTSGGTNPVSPGASGTGTPTPQP